MDVIFGLVGIVIGWVLSILTDPLKEWWLGPKLFIRFNPDSPVDTHITPMFRSDGSKYPSFWARGRVVNDGRSVAREVEVIAQKLERLDAGGGLEAETRFAPLNLKWSYVGVPLMERIPRQTERLVDVFWIPWTWRDEAVHPKGVTRPSPSAHLAVVEHSAAQPGTLEPGRYRLHLIATAANSSSLAVVAFVFTVPKQWNAEQIRTAIDAQIERH